MIKEADVLLWSRSYFVLKRQILIFLLSQSQSNCNQVWVHAHSSWVKISRQMISSNISTHTNLHIHSICSIGMAFYGSKTPQNFVQNMQPWTSTLQPSSELHQPWIAFPSSHGGPSAVSGDSEVHPKGTPELQQQKTTYSFWLKIYIKKTGEQR